MVLRLSRYNVIFVALFTFTFAIGCSKHLAENELSAEEIPSSRESKNKENYINNIYVLNLSKEDVAEFEKRQANVSKLKCTRTGSTSYFCESHNN